MKETGKEGPKTKEGTANFDCMLVPGHLSGHGEGPGCSAGARERGTTCRMKEIYPGRGQMESRGIQANGSEKKRPSDLRGTYGIAEDAE